MKIADKIKFDLMKYAASSAYDILIPNFYYGFYEMDLFKLMKSGYIVEYEIKISRSDYKADFNKGGGAKHALLAGGSGKSNRFFFVVPEDLITIDEVPKYAGLIYHTQNGIYIVKNAPIIHKNKPSESIYRMLAHKLSFRSRIIESKYRKALKLKK